MNKRFEIIIKRVRGTVLHLGSNNSEKGENLNKLLERNHKVYSCDIIGNPDFKIDLNKNKWPINKKFDTIVAGEIIEHVENPLLFIKNCYNLLNKEGKLILTTPNATSLSYIMNLMWCVGSDKNLCHIHAFTSGMIYVLIKNAGFKNINIKYLNSYSKNIFTIFISKIIPRLSGGIICIGNK